MSQFSRHSRLAERTLMVLLLLNTAPALAENTLLSGVFDGGGPVVTSLWPYESCQKPLSYHQTTFHVSSSGSYELSDALDNLWGFGAVPAYPRVYQGGFNPAAPSQDVMSPVDHWRYTFSSGVTYVLVVQHGCAYPEGAWAIWFHGPGSVSSHRVVEVPDFTNGYFTSSTTMTSGCSRVNQSYYYQSDPVQVSRDGTYYFSDTSMDWGVHVCLQVYTAPVNPADPATNRVGSAEYGQPRIKLKTGQDYYFVVQHVGGQKKTPNFLFVLAPPAPIHINPGLSGSWHNPDTPGQGFFLTAYENINKVFLAWFTYANESPAGDEFGHRWMTAIGKYAGASAELSLEWTEGGRFDAATPAPKQHMDGTIELEFTDCTSGQVSYSWGDGDGTPDASGVIPIKRLANDSVALCESLYARPGRPGPL